jgi:hypothetical protein
MISRARFDRLVVEGLEDQIFPSVYTVDRLIRLQAPRPARQMLLPDLQEPCS